MKTSRLLGFALWAISFGLLGCGEIENPIEPTPDPKPEEAKSEITIDADIITNGLSFTSDKGEKSISFTTNEDWSLSIAAIPSGDTWCSTSTTSGAKGTANVKFSVTENTSYDNRSVSVTIKSGTASKTFTITQKYAEALLLTTNKYELGQDGGTIEIEVKANIDYEMEIAESAKTWITEVTTRALSSYKHTLNIAINEEVEKREGEIYFKSGDRVEIVKVYQSGAGPLILLSRNEYYTSSVGETITIDIRSNCEYDTVMPNVDWIRNVPKTKAMSSHTLKYEILPNETYENRDALIVFKEATGAISDTLHIIQAQKDAIILSQKEIEVNFIGGTFEVKLESNTDFDLIMPENNWVTEIQTRAFTTYSKTFHINENDSEETRSCHIVFQSNTMSVSDTLTICQKGKKDYLYFENNIAVWTSRGYVQKVKIHSDVEYDLTWVGGRPNWLDHITGERDGIGIQLNDNTSVKPRSAALVAISSHLTDTLMVVQEGTKGIELSESYLEFDQLADTILVTVYASIDHQIITPSVDWLKVETIDHNEITMAHSDYIYTSTTLRLFVASLDTSEDYRTVQIFIKDNNDINYDYDKVLTITQHKNKIANTYTMDELYLQRNNTELEDLCIKGDITRKDFNYLRTLAGGDIYCHRGSNDYFTQTPANPGKLKRLDLSQAKIVARKGGSYTYGQEIYWQDENTLDSYHFSSTKLETIILPDNIIEINKNTFENCTELTTIILGANVRTIQDNAFKGCVQLKHLTIPFKTYLELKDKDSFKGCNNLKSLVFVGKFSLPKDADYKGTLDDHGLFGSTNLTSLVIGENTPYLPPYTFYGCHNLEGELVFKGVKELGEMAFYSCNKIRRFTFIDAQFTRIGRGAFSECTSMTSFEVPASVTIISGGAFSNCIALERITISENVNLVGFDAFSGCEKLKTIMCYPTTPPETRFTIYNESTTLYVPKGTLNDYKQSEWGRGFKNIVEME